MEYGDVAVEPISIGTIPAGLVKGFGRLRNKRIKRDHPDYSVFKIGQNTEKSPWDLRRLALTQTPMSK